MYDTILIPYDGSDEAKKATREGIKLAAAVGASVRALYVIDLPGAPRALSIRDDEERMRKEYREYGEKVLGDIADLADEHGVECESAFRTGSVAEEIVEYAEEEGMDAIVMGSAYRGKLGGVLGGNMDKVVRTATVPVLTYRQQMGDHS